MSTKKEKFDFYFSGSKARELKGSGEPKLTINGMVITHQTPENTVPEDVNQAVDRWIDCGTEEDIKEMGIW